MTEPRNASVLMLMAGILLASGCKGRPKVSFKELADADPHIRADAALRLGQARAKDGVDSLIAVLDDPDVLVRINAVRALGEIGDAKAAPALVPLAGDPSPAVREAVTQSFGALRDPVAVATLRTLLDDADDGVRISAARALGTIPGEAAMSALVDVGLRDEDESVRQQVVRVVSEHGEHDAIARLERMLEAGSSTESDRAVAARTLGDLGCPSSVPALIEALGDPDVEVRSIVAHSLGRIGADDPRALEALAARFAREGHGIVKIDLAWNLALGGDRSGVGAVRNLLFDGEEEVRAEAARALGEIGDNSDVALLERALGDKKGLVRQEAGKSLEKLKKS